MAVADVEIARAALAGGFPRNAIVTAVAVALAESGGNATATNNKNSNGTSDYGLWQINSIHKADLASGDWRNPTDNARMAYAVYKRAGQTWWPWYAYRDNHHLKFMSRGQKAAIEAGAESADDNNGLIPDFIEGPSDAAQAAYQKAGRALDVITDRDTWVRAGLMILGILILLVAVVAILMSLRGTGPKQLIGQVTKAGAK